MGFNQRKTMICKIFEAEKNESKYNYKSENTNDFSTNKAQVDAKIALPLPLQPNYWSILLPPPPLNNNNNNKSLGQH